MSVGSQCVFCEIIAGEAEASIIFQDKFVTAFMDIHPVVQGHSLVVPNVHYPNLSSIIPIHAQRMFIVGQKIADAIGQSNLRCEGINLYIADGRAAGQTVFHPHLHVIPRYFGDGFSIILPTGYGEQPMRVELDKIAADIALFMSEESGE